MPGFFAMTAAMLDYFDHQTLSDTFKLDWKRVWEKRASCASIKKETAELFTFPLIKFIIFRFSVDFWQL